MAFSRVLVYGFNKTLDGQLDGGITDGVNAELPAVGVSAFIAAIRWTMNR